MVVRLPAGSIRLPAFGVACGRGDRKGLESRFENLEFSPEPHNDVQYALRKGTISCWVIRI